MRVKHITSAAKAELQGVCYVSWVDAVPRQRPRYGDQACVITDAIKAMTAVREIIGTNLRWHLGVGILRYLGVDKLAISFRRRAGRSKWLHVDNMERLKVTAK